MTDSPSSPKLVEMPERSTDSEVAKAIKDEAESHLLALTALMDRARAKGMEFNFNLGFNAFGRAQVMAVTVVKPL